MTYLQLFGLAFIVLHSISILFITKLSLAKRLFLAFWMALFVMGVPKIYAYLPTVAFAAICLFALSIYVITLFFQESMALKDRLFRKPRRSTVANRGRDIEDGAPFSVSSPETAPASLVNSAVSLASAPVASKPETTAEVSSAEMSSAAVQPTGRAIPSADQGQGAGAAAQPEEQSLVSDMLQKLEQIDTLMSTDRATAAEAKAETERLSETLLAFDRQAEAGRQKASTPGDSAAEKSAGQGSSLEAMFFGSNQKAAAEQPKRPSASLNADKEVHPLTEAEEEVLLNEIDDIIASHTDLEKEWSAKEAAADPIPVHYVSSTNTLVPSIGDSKAAADPNADVFTLRPIAEQTIEIIKEKQGEDGLLSVEEQLDKELYFQFLLYESKELLTMGMYQETVDYLKEILIDSYDKALRREALALLESIRVDLYHPNNLGFMDKDLKKLEERKVL